MCICAPSDKALKEATEVAPNLAGASACGSQDFTCEDACRFSKKGNGRAVIDVHSSKAACLIDAIEPGKVTARAMCCADGFQTFWYKSYSDDYATQNPNVYEARKCGASGKP